MKVYVEITLNDYLWGEYKNINPELFLEDLFEGWSKGGVENVKFIE